MPYARRRVLVTGAGGFIGSHLVEALVAAGAQVTALVHYDGRGTRGDLAVLPAATLNEVRVAGGDVRDAFFLARLVAQHEVVFHLAALVGIPYSYQAPQSYLDTNVQGTLNVLEAARAAGVARLVHVSTSEVYGTAQTVPIDERHPLRAQSPYAASKLGGEALAASYHASFGLPVTIVRPFNTYGPRQSRRAVIPAILAQLVRRVAVLRLGALAPRRDFTYVTDTVQGLLALGAADAAVGAVTNLGSGRDISVGELAALCCEVADYHPPIATDPERTRPPESEVQHLCCDASRAAQLAGWEPRVSLRDGLAATLANLAQRGADASDDGYAV